MTKYITLFVVLTVFLIGCSKDDNKKTDGVEKDNFVINNNQDELKNRVVTKNDTVEITPLEEDGLKSATTAIGVSFVLKAEVLPPIVGADTLQASHVTVVDNFAFVTYNTQGEKYAGGLELFDISNPDLPVLVWSAVSVKTDFSSVDFKDSKLYLAGAWNLKYNYKNLEKPAFLQVLNLNQDMQIESTDTVICLDSYVGTDVVVEPNRIYTTSGSDGYFRVFNDNYETVYNQQIDEARSISYNGTYVCVLQGMPGWVHKFNKSHFYFYFKLYVNDANIPESKSEIVALNDYFITALNEGGVKAMDYLGKTLFTIPKPATPQGKDPWNYVSNSVSVNNNLMFIANGGAGIYVAKLQDNNATLLGSMQLENETSVNFVEAKNNILFAATGKGGFKIIKMTTE